MNNILVFLTMFFLHIVADYNLQGILASMKQKKYWEDELSKIGMSQDEKDKYKYDYIAALFTHSFAWTFLFMLPLLFVFKLSVMYYILFIINLILHTVIDDLKANKFKINLVEDQLLHLIQIIVTWALFCII